MNRPYYSDFSTAKRKPFAIPGKRSRSSSPILPLAFCAHYVADLSQPLHNTEHDLFNLTYHKDIDGIVNDGILGNLDRIKIYPIIITLDETLAKEIVSWKTASEEIFAIYFHFFPPNPI